MVGRGRAPCCDKSKVKSGAWSPEEDFRLVSFIHTHGHPNWRALPSQAGLLRCGKSCRLRWINYLRPNVKRGNLTQQEEEIVINLHQSLGNKWSKIAASLPGRTDNEIKNIWNTHLKKKVMMMKKNDKYGTPPSDDHDQYSSSFSSSNSNDQINMMLTKNVIEPESEAAKQAASLSHSCSFSSSNSSNDIVGQKGGEELIDHDHDQFKEWLRSLENELGLSEEEKTLTLSHVDDDLDRGLVQVQDMNQIIINDGDIIIDQNLINVSISSWQVLFSSLPHL